MIALGRDDLRELLTGATPPCVSIYLPTHRAGADIQQDPIRLKNLLAQAEQRLVAAGMRSPDAKALLEPARPLLDDRPFWQHQSDGLAVFLAPGLQRVFRVPYRFEELVIVAGRFHTKPLLSLFVGDGLFYVLAVSQNEVRLLRGTQHSVGDLELNGVPKSLEEAMKYDEAERQVRSVAGAKGARRSAAVFYGHGGEKDVSKDNILRFFQQVDRGLRELFKDEHAPLVLAGDGFLLPIYREANGYAHLVPAGIEGNPDHIQSQELHRRAWAIVQPLFHEAQQAAAAAYRQLAGTGRTSNNLAEVVPAAIGGRIETLFVPVGGQRWGAFDAAAGTVTMHDQPQSGDVDLLDLAAAETLRHRGRVFAVPTDQIPDGHPDPVAAIYRF